MTVKPVNDAYRITSKFYDWLIEPLNRGLRNVGLKMFPPEDRMNVLDIGCGTGSHLLLYKKAGCSVFGVDVSPSMLKRAQMKLGDEAGLVLGDASKMSYPDRFFDLILMTLVLHEMAPDVRKAVLAEAKRVLKEDGKILLIDYHPGPVRSLKGKLSKGMIVAIEKAAGGDHYRNFRHFLGNQGLEGLAAALELQVDACKIVTGGNLGLFLLHP